MILQIKFCTSENCSDIRLKNISEYFKPLNTELNPLENYCVYLLSIPIGIIQPSDHSIVYNFNTKEGIIHTNFYQKREIKVNLGAQFHCFIGQNFNRYLIIDIFSLIKIFLFSTVVATF